MERALLWAAAFASFTLVCDIEVEVLCILQQFEFAIDLLRFGGNRKSIPSEESKCLEMFKLKKLIN